MGKKMHLKCPKCNYDFEYNEGYVERKIDELRMEIHSIDSQLADFKAKHPYGYKTDPWYRSAVKAKTTKTEQLSEIRNYRKLAYNQRDVQMFYALKARLRRELGEEKYMQLIQELEDELRYNVADLAKQKYTNFNGV